MTVVRKYGEKYGCHIPVVLAGGISDRASAEHAFGLGVDGIQVATRFGNKIMIGKGKRDAAVKEAVVRNGAVYLAALGGAGALMAQSVKTLEVIAWPDLGCEAVRRLTVEKMPLTVILDAHGGDLYTSGPAAYLETVK